VLDFERGRLVVHKLGPERHARLLPNVRGAVGGGLGRHHQAVLMDKGGERVLVAAMKRIIEEADGLSGVLGGGWRIGCGHLILLRSRLVGLLITV
jgi:hypothetical protein